MLSIFRKTFDPVQVISDAAQQVALVQKYYVDRALDGMKKLLTWGISLATEFAKAIINKPMIKKQPSGICSTIP